eukprot:CAMPEP_0183583194 /NCGR_PEP_ID=MMETSP0371-20130417/151148_1 /TAXON_ID=268820 /ORGANISM="Peridinium aciculiferum, Strain PAER-2" /LENGTH=62 /DNA_ID=CAMNT_0025794009 /DNA_START=17 /DNA_END=201 /DNA_ORIENTATION=+
MTVDCLDTMVKTSPFSWPMTNKGMRGCGEDCDGGARTMPSRDKSINNTASAPPSKAFAAFTS